MLTGDILSGLSGDPHRALKLLLKKQKKLSKRYAELNISLQQQLTAFNNCSDNDSNGNGSVALLVLPLKTLTNSDAGHSLSARALAVPAPVPASGSEEEEDGEEGAEQVC